MLNSTDPAIQAIQVSQASPANPANAPAANQSLAQAQALPPTKEKYSVWSYLNPFSYFPNNMNAAATTVSPTTQNPHAPQAIVPAPDNALLTLTESAPDSNADANKSGEGSLRIQTDLPLNSSAGSEQSPRLDDSPVLVVKLPGNSPKAETPKELTQITLESQRKEGAPITFALQQAATKLPTPKAQVQELRQSPQEVVQTPQALAQLSGEPVPLKRSSPLPSPEPLDSDEGDMVGNVDPSSIPWVYCKPSNKRSYAGVVENTERLVQFISEAIEKDKKKGAENAAFKRSSPVVVGQSGLSTEAIPLQANHSGKSSPAIPVHRSHSGPSSPAIIVEVDKSGPSNPPIENAFKLTKTQRRRAMRKKGRQVRRSSFGI